MSMLRLEFRRENFLPGVRQLERELGSLCRAVATRVAEGLKETVTVDTEFLRSCLGQPKFLNEIALRTSLPGVATGLAWTTFGGDILFVEATKMTGDGKLLLTGQLSRSRKAGKLILFRNEKGD
jgi:ATP-dependent Lon protease